MDAPANQPVKLQLVEGASHKRAETQRELSARDYSPVFQERVTGRFMATQSIKQTARDYAIPARTVSEILHLATLKRKGPDRASAAFGIRRMA